MPADRGDDRDQPSAAASRRRPRRRHGRHASAASAPCRVLHAKFVALGHNTVRGAAGAAILNAELMAAEGCSGLGLGAREQGASRGQVIEGTCVEVMPSDDA